MQRVRIRRPVSQQQRPLSNTFWSGPLPDNATLHPNSAAIVAEVVRQRGLALPIVNGGQALPIWSSKITVVPADQPVLPGVCAHDSIQSAIAATGIPVPPDVYVPPSPDTDKAVLIYQPDAPNGGVMWELQGFGWITPGVQWHANSLSRMTGVNARRVGHFVDWADGPGGSTPGALYSTWEAEALGIQGSGLPYGAGLVTRDDVLRGYVNHAVLMEVYDAAKGGHVWPAIARSDGGAVGNPISEGMWLRLPAGFVIPVTWSLMTRLYAQAARDFGILITDRTLFGLAVRLATDAHDLCDDLHLVNYPWTSLQALAVGSDALWHPTS